MKRTFFICILAMSAFAFASCSTKTTQHDMTQMPVAAQKIVKDNFSSKVAAVEVETNVMGANEYEVRLADGTEIQFVNEEWDEVKVPAGKSVPEYFVLQPIRTFLAENQPGLAIVSVDRDSKGYEVKLANGVEVKFDTAGKFVKYDH